MKNQFLKKHTNDTKLSHFMDEIIPKNYKNSNLKKTCKAGLFAGSLELVKEGLIIIKQEKLFDDILIKHNYL